MGYEVNAAAYKIFTQIEVGIRELLIALIKDYGVSNWVQTFLGSSHLDNVKSIAKRIHDAEQKQEEPQIEDVYLVKLNRALKSSKEAFKSDKLFHPFYYLNWVDMDALMNKNSELINKFIGKLNRELIVTNLKALSFLRNDIAHSRFISENDFNYVQSAFLQISALVPNFEKYYTYQSTEYSYQLLIEDLTFYLNEIQVNDMLEMETLNAILIHLEKCLDSFWLNSFRLDLIPLICQLNEKVKQYHISRNIPGGLLAIQKWKSNNSYFLNTLKKNILDRQIRN